MKQKQSVKSGVIIKNIFSLSKIYYTSCLHVVCDVLLCIILHYVSFLYAVLVIVCIFQLWPAKGLQIKIIFKLT